METGGDRTVGQPRQRQTAAAEQRRDSTSARKNQRGVSSQGNTWGWVITRGADQTERDEGMLSSGNSMGKGAEV